MSRMEFSALPIRSIRPKSLVDDQLYKLLYANNETALKNFLTFKLPLHNDELLAMNDFIVQIQKQEHGPSVDYEGLRTNITALRGSLNGTTTGIETLNFFKKLFQVRANWTLAAARFHSFDIFGRMIKAVFLEHNDPKLFAVFDLDNPSIKAMWKAGSAALSKPEYQTTLKVEWDRRHQELDKFSRQLYDLKLSSEMWTASGRLQEVIELHAKLLAEVREQDARVMEEHTRRKKEIKTRNTESIMAQMGMAGTRPISEDAAAMLGTVANTHKHRYFTFTEEECSVSLYVEQEN